MTDTLPTGRAFSPQEISRLFLWYDAVPYENPDLALRLLVPNGWRVDAATAETPDLTVTTMKPLVLLAEPDGGAYLQVQAVRLEYDLSAEHWLRFYMIQAGYRPRAMRELSPVFADSLCDFSISDVEFTGRLAARVVDDRLFMIFGFAPAERYQALAESFGVAVASFKPAKPPSHPGVEPWVTLSAGTVPFSCPPHWTAIPARAPQGIAGIDLTLTVADALTGWMRVKTVSRELPTDMELQVQTTLDALARDGLQVSRLIANTGISLEGTPFTGGFLQVFEAHTSADLPQEIWLAVLEDKDRYVVVFLVTPDRVDHFQVWTRNRRAFGIVLGSLGR
ncbi:hypothetical protein JHL17_10885 [Azospirillum sp. YIM B02556]|uniref:Uncharacterized protein n=1 Tax=Azospirillum endophyticum TaxID=2800326 RepID=A0ABS1F3I4_9PROT|nr:hypothetical protein [Azospirillum endophyticum]MBK1837919.1 hypothetical protein [Azospirillum endophyticum]